MQVIHVQYDWCAHKESFPFLQQSAGDAWLPHCAMPLPARPSQSFPLQPDKPQNLMHCILSKDRAQTLTKKRMQKTAGSGESSRSDAQQLDPEPYFGILKAQSLHSCSLCTMAEEYVTLLRIKRNRDDTVEQDLGEIAPNRSSKPLLCNTKRNPSRDYHQSSLSCYLSSTMSASRYLNAVVEGLSERPKKRAAVGTSLANMTLEEERPDVRKFSHIACLPVDRLDWSTSQQKIACLLDSVNRCACL